MQDSFKLGSIGGVKIGVNWSFILLAGLIAYFLATSRLPVSVPGYSASAYWAAGGLTALALFAGVLVHEGAHAIAARRAKMEVDGITLWFMGGVTRIEGESQSPLSELVIALVGPVSSAALGGGSLLLSSAAQAAGWRLLAGSLAWLGLINLLLAALNLVPASPLDGGRVLHGLVWWASKDRWLATRVTAGAGTALGVVCAFLGFMAFGQRDAIDGVTLMMMGWFVLASSKREQIAGRAQHVLGDVRVSDIMRRAVLAPGWLTVGAFWEEWAKHYPDAAFMLERWAGEGWAGAVTTQQLASVPPGMQFNVRAQDVALPLAGGSGHDLAAALGPGDPALAIAGRAGAVLPVKEGDALVGAVWMPDIAALVAKGVPARRRTWGSAIWPPPSRAPARYV